MTEGLSGEKEFLYQFNAGGVLTRLQYPSGRVVNYEMTGANRLGGVKKGDAGSDYYLSGMSYSAAGQQTGATVGSMGGGTAFAQTWSYNSRLQARQMAATKGAVNLLTMRWAYGGSFDANTYAETSTDNNGNVRGEKVEYSDGGATKSIARSFGYDGMNRIASFSESTGKSQSFGYDGDGNWKDWLDVGVLTYDGENRVTKVVGASGTATFEYDGQGRRVRKTAGGVETTFVYDADGEVAAEYGGTSTLTGRHFVTADHLGSTRVLTNVTGGRVHCADYLPFGEEIRTGTALSVRAGVGCYGTAGMERKFTGKERDGETGLDYFGARYLSSAQGRFISLDPALESADEEDPQSWNRYVYTLNNPQKFVDPDGAIPVPAIIVGGSAAAGAVVGAAVGGWKGGWSGAVKGLISGGIGGAAAGLAVFTGGSSLGGALGAGITGGAVSGGVSGAVENAMEGRSLTHNAVANVAAGAIGGAAGAAAGKLIGASLQKSGLAAAETARDALGKSLGKLPASQRPATVTGGYNTRTGEVAARACGGGKCAEDHVVSALGGNKANVKLTKATRPRDTPLPHREVPVCTRCEATYGRDAFPRDTRFQSDQE